ncbi:MAG: hypothetical protein R2752_01580 [Vicinamibacterales bacterium]
MSRIARLIVRLYPAEWRDRHAAAMLAMLEQDRVRAADLLDLLRGALGERGVWRWPMAVVRRVGAAYLACALTMAGGWLVVFIGRGLVRAGLAGVWIDIGRLSADLSRIDSGPLARALPVVGVLGFTLILITAAPVLAVLAGVRLWSGRPLRLWGGLVCAASAAWWLHDMAWTDFWRHGPTLIQAANEWLSVSPYLGGAFVGGWFLFGRRSTASAVPPDAERLTPSAERRANHDRLGPHPPPSLPALLA